MELESGSEKIPVLLHAAETSHHVFSPSPQGRPLLHAEVPVWG